MSCARKQRRWHIYASASQVCPIIHFLCWAMPYFSDIARTPKSLPSHPVTPSTIIPKRKRESSSSTVPGMSILIRDPAVYADSLVVNGSSSTGPSSGMLQAITNINPLKELTKKRRKA